MWRRAVLILGLIVMMPSAVWAGTVTGVTGLFNVPAATTLQPQLMEASVHVLDGSPIGALTVGVVEQIEVGVYTLDREGPLNLTVKGVVVAESEETPAIAVGIDGTSPYFVISRQMEKARGYAGIGGRFGGLFGGLEMPLNTAAQQDGGPVMSLVLEHDGKGINFGARASFEDKVSVDLGILDMTKAVVGITLTTLF